MDIKDAFGKVADVIKWAIVGSIGWLVYGMPKAVIEYTRRSQWSAKLNDVTQKIEALKTTLAVTLSPIGTAPLSLRVSVGIGLDGRKNVEKTEGTQPLQLQLLLKLQKQNQAEFNKHDKELKTAKRAMIPLVGAYLANKLAKHSGIMAGLTHEIAKEISAINRVFFVGNQAATLTVHNLLAGGPKTYTGLEAKVFWESHGAQRRYLPVSYVDATGKACTRKIESMFLPGSPKNGCKGIHDKTVVISHGAPGTLYGTFILAAEYQRLGYNVVSYTHGGKQYSQVSPPPDAHNKHIETSELTICQDVDAVMLDLKKRGVQEVVWHGHSIGGVAMGYAAERYGKGCPRRGVEDFPAVEKIVADQTLTQGEAVASNFAANLLGSEFQAIGAGIGRAAAPIGTSDGVHTSTGLNTLARVEKLQNSQVEVAAIAAPLDHMMGHHWNKDRLHYEGHFPLDLLKARYPNDRTRPDNCFLLLHPEAGHGWNPTDDLFKLIPPRKNT